MTPHRLRRAWWFPRRWRERYGREFDSLIDELVAYGELTARDRLDLVRSGVVLHRRYGDPRRLIAATLVVALVAGGSVALAMHGERLAPAPSSVGVQTAVAIDPATCAGAPTADSGLGARHGEPVGGRPFATFNGAPLTDSEVTTGAIGGLPWGLYSRTAPLGGRNSAIARLEDGGLVLGQSWYSTCASLPSPVQTGGLGGIDLGPSAFGWPSAFHVVNAGASAVVYGYVPSSATRVEVMASSSSSVRASTWPVGTSGAEFFIARLTSSACANRWVQYTAYGVDASPFVGTPPNLSAYAGVSENCARGALVEENPARGTVPPRTTGTVSAIGSDSLVLTSPFWPPLSVHVSPGTTIGGTAEELPATFADLQVGDQVRVQANVRPSSSTRPAVTAALSVTVAGGGELFTPINAQVFSHGPSGEPQLVAYEGTISSITPSRLVLRIGGATTPIALTPATSYIAPGPLANLSVIRVLDTISISGRIEGDNATARSIQMAGSWSTGSSTWDTSVDGPVISVGADNFEVGWNGSAVVVRVSPTTMILSRDNSARASLRSLRTGELVNADVEAGSDVVANFVSVGS